jgi:hypothetical protein
VGAFNSLIPLNFSFMEKLGASSFLATATSTARGFQRSTAGQNNAALPRYVMLQQLFPRWKKGLRELIEKLAAKNYENELEGSATREFKKLSWFFSCIAHAHRANCRCFFSSEANDRPSHSQNGI